MFDTNKVILSGIAQSKPIFTKMTTSTPITTFTLQINEQFKDRTGKAQYKINFITIEALGRLAENTINLVKEGKRYVVDGYIRQDLEDGVNYVRVRAFLIYPDRVSDSFVFEKAVKKSLDVLKTSRSLEDAKQKLECLIKEDSDYGDTY